MSAKPPKVEVAGEAIVNPFRVRTATVAVMSRPADTFTLRLAAVMLVTEAGDTDERNTTKRVSGAGPFART